LPLRLVEPPPLDAVGVRAATGGPGAASLTLGPVPKGPLNKGWARSSYTSWTHDRRRDEGDGEGLGAEALEEGRDTSDPSLLTPTLQEDDLGLIDGGSLPREAAAETPLWPERGRWADLPGGAGFGDCLHRVLEQIDYGAALPTPASQSLAEHELRRAGLQAGFALPLLEAIHQMLQTPFGGALGALRPANLQPWQRLNELHFDLSLGHVKALDLAQAYAEHPGGPFGKAYAEALAKLPVHHCGFLTGSIDLVFPARVNGSEQWWVLDWKSNWLGQRDQQGRSLSCGPGDYGPEALHNLMASHHYPLQAHLYLVALHRYLAWRLPAYNPEQHLGGYAYVFVRGTPGEAGGGLLPGPIPGMVVERPPLERLLALDRALGAGPPGWEPGTHP